MNTKEIFGRISIIYSGVELNKIKELKEYGEYICNLLDSDEKHSAALLMHTGSNFYRVVAISVAAIHCLFYSNTDVDELISTLAGGEMLLLNGERVQFGGFKTGAELGYGYKKETQYFVYNAIKGRTYIPVDKAKTYNISLYRGDSDSLGDKGIKNTLRERADFLGAFGSNQKGKKVSTKINHSFAVISDRDVAEDIYRNTILAYDGKKFSLSKIVTATYFSDNESYQLGSNPAKEEPIIRFYSKISACREDVFEDKAKSILGCIACDENIWYGSSEIHDLADRKSLKYALLLAKTHYTDYSEWVESEKYKLYAMVPEVVDYKAGATSIFNNSFIDYNEELKLFSERQIKSVLIEKTNNSSDVSGIKLKLLKIKNDIPDDDEKEEFLMASYFLLNLCRSAFFPLSYCDKAYEAGLLQWSLSVKTEAVKAFADKQIGEIKEAANFVYQNILQLINELYTSNPKGEYIKKCLTDRRSLYIVATKAYYGTLFSMWLKDCGLTVRNFYNIVTASALSKAEEYIDNVIFTTAYYDRYFNEYAEFSFGDAEVLCYSDEKYQARFLKNIARNGMRLIHGKNYFDYELPVDEKEEKPIEDKTEISDTDNIFESEMDKLAKELQLRGANTYLRASNSSGDGTSKIEKILAFSSRAVGFFTKRYKAYRISGDKIDEVGLQDLKVGDSIIFTKETENKDIVDALLVQLLENQYKNTLYPQYYEWSVSWKKELRQYMKDNNMSYQDLSDKLAIMGCDKHQVTIRSWLYEETHIVGPRDLDDFYAITKLVKGHTAEELKKGCDEIRSLRTRILRLLAKVIIKRMSADKSDELWDTVLSKAENLSQIEQITDINDVVDGKRMSLNLINKPLNI